MKKISFFALLAAVLLPISAQAKSFKEIINFIVKDIIEKTVLPFLLSMAVIAFLWGVFRYIQKGSETKVKEGRDMMVYGLIGLAAIVSVWGLVRILIGTFLLTDTQIIDQQMQEVDRFDFFRTGV